MMSNSTFARYTIVFCLLGTYLVVTTSVWVIDRVLFEFAAEFEIYEVAEVQKRKSSRKRVECVSKVS